MKNKIKLAFIGCGNMARAMITSMTNPSVTAVLKDSGFKYEIVASDVDEAQLMPIKHLCAVTLDSKQAVCASDYVVLAIKPQDFESAVKSVGLKDKTVISIMAGVDIETLRKVTGSARIVRVMPNICAQVGESFNAYTAYGVDDKELVVVLTIMGGFGRCVAVKESDLDVVTGIGGCGPAFVFMAIKAFYDEAIARGLPGDIAKDMALQTVIGSALTAEKFDGGFDSLVNAVRSSGGATESGVKHLINNDFEGILRGAFDAAIARVEEMSK